MKRKKIKLQIFRSQQRARLEIGRGPLLKISCREKSSMSKRAATTQLTREDLDRDDSPEREEPPPDTGLRVASQEILANRPILKARRNKALSQSISPSDPDCQTESPSPFARLLKAPLVAPSAGPVSFAFLSKPAAASSTQPASLPFTMSSLPNGNATATGGAKKSYKEVLTSLNKSLHDHITKVLATDPSLSLKKNCEEYIKFIDQLDAGKTAAQSATNRSTQPQSSASITSPTTSSTVPSSTQPSSQPFSSTTVTSGFSFFTNKVSQASTSTSSAVIPAPSTTAPVSAFSSQSSFNFGNKLDSNFKFGSTSGVTSTPIQSTPTVFGSSPFASSSKPQFGSSSVPSFGVFLNKPSAAVPSTPSKSSSQDTADEGEDEGDNHEPPKLTDAKMDEKDSIYSKV